MARTDPQVNLRLPALLKSRVERAAEQSGRSVNAEIVHRLEASLKEDVGAARHVEARLREFEDLQLAIPRLLQEIGATEFALSQGSDPVAAQRLRLLRAELDQTVETAERVVDDAWHYVQVLARHQQRMRNELGAAVERQRATAKDEPSA